MSLMTILFAPVLFLYALIRSWEMLLAIDKIEQIFDLLQAKLFATVGFDLKFKVHEKGVIFITDTSTPVGSHCCVSLAKQGYTVFAGTLQISDAHKLKKYVSNPDLIIPVQLDITNQTHIQTALEQITHFLTVQQTEHQNLVGILNTTGLQLRQPLETSTVEEWQNILNVNLVGPFAVISAFMPLLRQSRGRVLNISSFAGQTSTPMNGCFAASKIALENATDTLRNEVYPFGVSVSLIIPGAIDITSKYSKLSGKKNPPSTTALAYSSINQTLYKSLENTARVIDREIANNRMSSSMVTKAVDHALFSDYPKARYLVGIDAKLTKWLKWLCSDRLIDWGYQLVVRKLEMQIVGEKENQ